MPSPDRIQVLRGDITTLKVDAIVNAANSSLMGGGGVDGAIHRAGGDAIIEECRKIVARRGSCKTGDAVITTAGNLPCNFVIHTVGPVWDQAVDQSDKLASCYWKSLKLALDHDCRSIAFPNISTGVYGYPKNEAAKVAVKTIRRFLEQENSPEQVILCCFDEENYQITVKELDLRV